MKFHVQFQTIFFRCKIITFPSHSKFYLKYPLFECFEYLKALYSDQDESALPARFFNWVDLHCWSVWETERFMFWCILLHHILFRFHKFFRDASFLNSSHLSTFDGRLDTLAIRKHFHRRRIHLVSIAIPIFIGHRAIHFHTQTGEFDFNYWNWPFHHFWKSILVFYTMI